MRLSEAVVVITGGGNGIGRALVLESIKRGARVAAVDLSKAALEETAKLANSPSAFEPFVLSVADRSAVDALPARVIERFGQVDIVINNAGIIQPFVRVADLDYATIDRVFDINFKGPLYMTKAFLPEFLKRPAAHIVNVSSMGGFLAVPGQTVYGASKAAVKLLTEGLWAELRDTNVRVTVVFPGGVATNIVGNSGVKLPVTDGASAKLLQPDEAARLILDGVEHDAFRVVVGRDANLLDKLYRLNPRRATQLVAKNMKRLLS